jgi:anti-sigma factor RsiW
MTRLSRDCERVLADVSAYLDGDLGPEACRALQQHCSGCEACRAMVRDLERTVGLCHEAAQRPLPPAVRRRARAQVARLLKGSKM